MATDVQLQAFQEQLASLDTELNRLSYAENSREAFFRTFLEKSVAVLGHGGGIWLRGEDDKLSPVCQINLASAGIDEGGSQYNLFVNAVKKVFEISGPVVLPAQGGTNVYDGGLGQAGVNNSPYALLFVPLTMLGRIQGVFVLISPPDVDPRAVRGYLGFVQGVCGHAGVFLQRKHVESLEERVNQSEEIHRYISALHSSLDPKRTCFALSNYAQEFLKVYRCMAGTFSPGGRFRMEAVSGVESVVVKSNFIQNISQIARQVCKNNKPLIVDNPNKAVDDIESAGESDILTAARLYMLQANTVVMGIFPISWEQQVVGALIVEKGEEIPFDQSELKQIDWMLVEAGSALSQSLHYRRLPLSLLVRMLAGLRTRLEKTPAVRKLIWAMIIVLVCAAPFLITMQTRVIGSAELTPVNARIAYAAQDGVIESVSIPDDRQVAQNQVLAELDKKIIESELDRVINSMNEADIQLRQARMNGQTVQEQQYMYRMDVLEAEKNKLTEQMKLFEIRSPVDGMVVNRDSELRLLPNKPVTRGEPVLEVVPDDADWQLQVFVPEQDAGKLLRAYDRLSEGEHLNARVILNAYPEKTFTTRVLSVARRAHVESAGSQDYRNVIEVNVAGPEELKETIDPRKGLEGKVAVECGRENLLYIATHEFVDFLRISFF